jgi:hypothetical protein
MIEFMARLLDHPFLFTMTMFAATVVSMCGVMLLSATYDFLVKMCKEMSRRRHGDGEPVVDSGLDLPPPPLEPVNMPLPPDRPDGTLRIAAPLVEKEQ